MRSALAAALAASSASALCADLKAKLASVDLSALAAASDARLAAAAPAGGEPQQLHLSLTGEPGEMFVTWVLPNVSAPCADAAAALGSRTFPAAHSTYSAGVAGWAGSIYTAKLAGLTPGVAVSYTVTACGGSAPARSFVAPAPPAPGARSRVAVKADMGTVIPLGFETAARITADHAVAPFDLVMLAGDLSYATVSPPKDEFEEVWDAWGRLIEPYTAVVPFMANVGNHEHTPGTLTNASGKFNVDYAAFNARYAAVPPNGNANLWYSFAHGPATYVFIDSEESQAPGSPQLTWFAATLAAVDRAVTPWLVVAQHRPLLCSTKSEAGDHTPGGTFLRALEPLLLQHRVDLVLTGHEHLYERMNAVANGTVVARAVNNTYSSPAAPVYVVQGTAGAFVSGDWADPQPDWSAVRDGVSYGYGNMLMETTAAGLRSLTYKFIAIDGAEKDHFIITKN